MQLTAKQQEGLDLILKAYKRGDPYICIAGYAGAGKAQPIDTIIPTPEGNKKIGDLQIGDYVFDRLGKPTKVLGVFPQGKKKVFTVHLKDGRQSECAEDHLWTVLNKKNQQQVLTTKELINKGLTNSAGFKYAVPNNHPVEYLEQNYDIDPYVIGAFLGDGCCKQRQLTISSEDEQIPTIIKNLIEAKTIEKNSNDNYNWTFTLAEPIIDLKNPVYSIYKFQTKAFFENYQKEICCEAQQKRIPEIYKRGSVQQRLDLLQGLMDTDGSISSNDGKRFNVRFTSTSYQLILDVKEILQSLGYGSTITSDKRTEKYTTGICYSLNINIPNEEKYKLFRLQRKKDIALEAKKYTKRKNYDKISIVDITTNNSFSEMVCIYVDNLEHLYLTKDFVVTHNTTLVRFVIESLGLDPELEVAYVAYTGKASEVLRMMGNPGATTAHKLLYSAKQKANGQYAFYPRKTLRNPDLKLIVADEVSMLPKKMWDLLLRHHIFVLATGDPFQLSPIVASDDNQVLDTPHVFLDEIMRQAKESEIIRLSMAVREMKPILPYRGKETQVLYQRDVTADMFTWADQIITATNDTRAKVNGLMRQMANRGDEPEVGDKIICLRNSWEMCSDQGNPLVNGSIGWIKDMRLETVRYKFNKTQHLSAPVLYATIDNGVETYADVPIDYNTLTKGQKTFSPRQEYVLRKHKDNPELPIEFDYGYAITCHRAQGSQWNKVFVYEEKFPFDRIQHARWLYTAVTRPSEKLILALK